MKAKKAVVNHAAKYIAEFVAKGGTSHCLSRKRTTSREFAFTTKKAGESEKNPALKLDTCVAMTQGSIGYWLQKCFN